MKITNFNAYFEDLMKFVTTLTVTQLTLDDKVVAQNGEKDGFDCVDILNNQNFAKSVKLTVVQ